MDKVEKKITDNFSKWRSENRKTTNTKDAIEEDIKEYMQTVFQIKHDVNILDILDTMIAPNDEASVAANGVRENVLACKTSTSTRRKRSNCELCCANSNFSLGASLK